jgi:ABC-type phosphate transport system substrate-binding protein
MNVRNRSIRSLISIAAAASIAATSIASIAAPAITTAATNCVAEQGSTTLFPALTQAQPGFQGAISAQTWPNASGVGCNMTLVANGSGAGKAALLDFYTGHSATQVDTAASSSPLSGGQNASTADPPNEIETTLLMAFQNGGDAMVIAVNKNNPVGQITMGEVTGIFNGSITTWQQLSNANGKIGTIVPRSRIPGSGTRDDMNRLFKMDRGNVSTSPPYTVGNPPCSAGFTTCEPTVIQATGLPRLTTSQDEADAACNNADQVVYTSLANLQAFGPGGANCLKALALQGCTYAGTPPVATCSGAFVMPTVTTAAISGGTYPARRSLFLTLPKVSTMAAKWGTGNGTGWTDQPGLTKAEDVINYMESTQGQTAVGAVGFVQISVPSKQPIPDADVDLNGGVGIGDIGNITGRWNATNTLPGWIRADVDNNGGIGIGDIGKITGQWGAAGFSAP